MRLGRERRMQGVAVRPAHGKRMPGAEYVLAAAVSLLTFILYLPALSHEFVNWDDGQYVYENLHIRSFDLNLFRWAFFDFYAANWHPLTWISHALDYAIWGLNPMGHHLTNNILHALNTFLVVLLVVRLIEAVPGKQQLSSSQVVEWPGNNSTTQRLNLFSPSRFTLIAAAVTGLLFGLHPIHVESVAWVAERKDLLCAFFFLLSVLSYTKYVTDTLQYAEGIGHSEKESVPSAESREQRAVFSMLHALYAMRYTLCFFVLALLSKPMAVSLPVVLLLLDWYPFQRIQSLKTLPAAVMEKLPFIALSIVSAILTILAQKAGGATELISSVPFSARLLVAAKSLVAYLWNMVSPLNLVPFYPYPKNVSPLSPEYFLPIVLIVAISISCMLVVRKQRLWLSCWAYYVITMTPVLGLVQVGYQAMADRYTYLPGLGPFLLAGLSTAWFSGRVSKTISRGFMFSLFNATAALLIIASMSYATLKQISIWKNSIVLWTYVIEKEPSSPEMAYSNRGSAFNDLGQFGRAIEDFSKAIALNPSYSLAYLNRGSAFINTVRPDRAMEDFSRVIAMEPLAEVYYLRGKVFEREGLSEKALSDYKQAIALKPSYGSAYFSLGVLYGKSGSVGKAIDCFDKYIDIMPDNFLAYKNRGVAYSLLGQYDKALKDLGKSIEFNSRYAEVYGDRGNVYLKIGQKELAVRDFQKACSLGDQQGCKVLQNF